MGAEQALQTAGQTPPPPLVVNALIDTGASNSSIQQGLVSSLGLQPVGQVLVTTPSSTNVPCLTYAVRLTFPHHGGGFVDLVTVTEMPLQGQNIQFLLGRDILKFAVLTYNGAHGSFTLSF